MSSGTGGPKYETIAAVPTIEENAPPTSFHRRSGWIRRGGRHPYHADDCVCGGARARGSDRAPPHEGASHYAHVRVLADGHACGCARASGRSCEARGSGGRPNAPGKTAVDY